MERSDGNEGYNPHHYFDLDAEIVLELIQEKVKPDFVDTFIAITSKRTTPKQSIEWETLVSI